MAAWLPERRTSGIARPSQTAGFVYCGCSSRPEEKLSSSAEWLIPEHARHKPNRRVDQGLRGEVAPGQDEVPERHLLQPEPLDQPLVHALEAPAEQDRAVAPARGRAPSPGRCAGPGATSAAAARRRAPARCASSSARAPTSARSTMPAPPPAGRVVHVAVAPLAEVPQVDACAATRSPPAGPGPSGVSPSTPGQASGTSVMTCAVQTPASSSSAIRSRGTGEGRMDLRPTARGAGGIVAHGRASRRGRRPRPAVGAAGHDQGDDPEQHEEEQDQDDDGEPLGARSAPPPGRGACPRRPAMAATTRRMRIQAIMARPFVRAGAPAPPRPRANAEAGRFGSRRLRGASAAEWRQGRGRSSAAGRRRPRGRARAARRRRSLGRAAPVLRAQSRRIADHVGHDLVHRLATRRSPRLARRRRRPWRPAVSAVSGGLGGVVEDGAEERTPGAAARGEDAMPAAPASSAPRRSRGHGGRPAPVPHLPAGSWGSHAADALRDDLLAGHRGPPRVQCARPRQASRGSPRPPGVPVRGSRAGPRRCGAREVHQRDRREREGDEDASARRAAPPRGCRPPRGSAPPARVPSGAPPASCTGEADEVGVVVLVVRQRAAAGRRSTRRSVPLRASASSRVAMPSTRAVSEPPPAPVIRTDRNTRPSGARRGRSPRSPRPPRRRTSGAPRRGPRRPRRGARRRCVLGQDAAITRSRRRGSRRGRPSSRRVRWWPCRARPS